MSDKIYTNCDRCDPERKQPFQFVTFTYRDGKPTYLCDDCLGGEAYDKLAKQWGKIYGIK